MKPGSGVTDEYGIISPVYLPVISNDSIKVAAIKTSHLSTDGDIRLREAAVHLFFYDSHDRLIYYTVFSSSGDAKREEVALFEFSYNENEELKKVKRTGMLYEAVEGAALLMNVWEAEIKSK